MDELRAQTGVEGDVPNASIKSSALFALAAVTGLGLGVVTIGMALTPIALLAWIVSYRRWRRSQALAA